MYTGGSMDATENYSLLYLWGALYAAYFFSQRVLLYHFAGGALGYGLVLLLKETNSEWISQWFLTMGSFVVAGIVVNWLTQQIRQLARTDSLTGLFNRRTMEEELARQSQDLQESLSELGRLREVQLGEVAELRQIEREHQRRTRIDPSYAAIDHPTNRSTRGGGGGGGGGGGE
jgi:hypothetical protein